MGAKSFFRQNRTGSNKIIMMLFKPWKNRLTFVGKIEGNVLSVAGDLLGDCTTFPIWTETCFWGVLLEAEAYLCLLDLNPYKLNCFIYSV